MLEREDKDVDPGSTLAKLLSHYEAQSVGVAEPSVSHTLREDASLYGTRSVRWIPVLSWTHAGVATCYDEIPKDWQEEVPVPALNEPAFCVIIEGDSMEPRCVAGDLAVVLPQREANNGNLVVAKFRDDGIVLRRYSRLSDGRIRLSAYNPVYPAEDHTPGAFRWIYPVHSTIRRELK